MRIESRPLRRARNFPFKPVFRDDLQNICNNICNIFPLPAYKQTENINKH